MLDALLAKASAEQSIDRLDLPHNTLKEDAVRGLKTRLRRPQLTAVFCDICFDIKGEIDPKNVDPVIQLLALYAAEG